MLILGSLPGDASIAAGQYYGHPRNDFWRLVGAVLERDLKGLTYDERLSALGRGHIGLWDVLAQAERKGSLDASIRRPKTSDIGELLARLPDLKAVAFNGALAGSAGERALGSRFPEVTRMRLPSSSPAHARSFTDKLEAWMALRRPLGLS